MLHFDPLKKTYQPTSFFIKKTYRPTFFSVPTEFSQNARRIDFTCVSADSTYVYEVFLRDYYYYENSRLAPTILLFIFIFPESFQKQPAYALNQKRSRPVSGCIGIRSCACADRERICVPESLQESGGGEIMSRKRSDWNFIRTRNPGEIPCTLDCQSIGQLHPVESKKNATHFNCNFCCYTRRKCET
jgi:hypothetical protein